MMCDAKTAYMCSAIPYVGNEIRNLQQPIPTQYILKLIEGIQGTNRNVTLDNWFSSIGKRINKQKSYHGGTIKTRRWHLRVFYGILDAAGINLHVIYKLNNETQLNRFDFLKQLSFHLVEDHLKVRVNIERIPRELRSCIQGIPAMDKNPVMANENVFNRRPGRCAFCPRNRDRKGQTVCALCTKSICAEHRFGLCKQCKEERT
ncbi:Transposase IS4 [Popillia japonica]|uniref:Transposase IS4 n=1 Tax=Popillia japonica TaxID=7064 RepID=A0AAW1IAM2_POPJA